MSLALFRSVARFSKAVAETQLPAARLFADPVLIDFALSVHLCGRLFAGAGIACVPHARSRNQLNGRVIGAGNALRVHNHRCSTWASRGAQTIHDVVTLIREESIRNPVTACAPLLSLSLCACHSPSRFFGRGVSWIPVMLNDISTSATDRSRASMTKMPKRSLTGLWKAPPSCGTRPTHRNSKRNR